LNKKPVKDLTMNATYRAVVWLIAAVFIDIPRCSLCRRMWHLLDVITVVVGGPASSKDHPHTRV